MIKINEDIFNKSSLPVISTKINDKEYSFIVDTGANISVFNVNDVPNDIEVYDEEYDFNGATQSSRETGRAYVILDINDQKYDGMFNVIDISSMTDRFNAIYNTNVCGLIGSQFLYDHEWVIDIKNMIINEP